MLKSVILSMVGLSLSFPTARAPHERAEASAGKLQGRNGSSLVGLCVLSMSGRQGIDWSGNPDDPAIATALGLSFRTAKENK